MANLVLINGESGSGKSTSIESLVPESTFLISVLGKPLPFKGWAKMYEQKSGGNYAVTDSPQVIQKLLSVISGERTHVKNVVLDDFTYIMTNAFMRRVMERGYDKFSDMAKEVWDILNFASSCRSDLNIFFLGHSQVDNLGISRTKTVGRLLDEKVCIEGMFTVVLHAMRTDDGYKFLTQADQSHLAKSPKGMFQGLYIDNNLREVSEAMGRYYAGE